MPVMADCSILQYVHLNFVSVAGKNMSSHPLQQIRFQSTDGQPCFQQIAANPHTGHFARTFAYVHGLHNI